MCGIAGIYGFRDDKLIKKISTKLAHRGPDGEGFFINDKVTLLNRRLAIIDVSGGDQPIYNENKTIVIVYNGEIYNYVELRKELEKHGHVFETKSDTEVIVHGYEQWGEKYFDRLNGMFAIALYDKKEDKLVLARDHFGIKPLYYTFLDNSSIDSVTHDTPQKINLARDIYRIMFSSEIKPILESGLIKKRPNDRVIYRYLMFRVHDDQKETFFDGIYRLMPGELLIIKNEELTIKNYTNLKEELLNIKETKKLGNWEIKKFKEKLIEAIRLRLISEVPVGSCLSGGLDSSTVVSVVNKLLKDKVSEAKSVGQKQKTFSAVFPEGSNDEEKYVDEVIKFRPKADRPLGEKLESHKVEPKPEEFFKEIEEFVKTQEEPTISTGPYAQFKLMEEAAKHVTVLLDGQGADEMMAGYLPYYFVYFRQLLKQKKYFSLAKEIFLSLDVVSSFLMKRPACFKKKVITTQLLNDNFAQKYRHEKFETINDNLKKRLVEDIFYNSLQSLLRYEDRNSMRFSIEGRVPFLDFNLLKYLFSLPDQAIINFGWNKNILRQATKDLLPELINKRRNKIGFTTPEYQWFMRMKNKIYQIFLSESFAKRPYFNQKEVLKTFQQFIEGKFDDTMVFWRLLNLELWLRIFFDEQGDKVVKFGEANEEKKIEITVEGKRYLRYPVRTEVFKKDDNVPKKIASLLHGYIANNNETMKQCNNKKWFLVISEKIVAISQGRSYFLWEISPGIFAKVLSNFVTKTPYGIGLGSPWTMQLAIREIGVIRVVLAAIIAGITKPLGIKGMFYRITGDTVRSIDGPTEYSLFPSNVSAKLGPKEPDRVARKIHQKIASLLHGYIAKNNNETMEQWNNFLGVVIIDANDLGQNVLANSTDLDNKLVEKIFADNPMGQANEQTPLVVVSIC